MNINVAMNGTMEELIAALEAMDPEILAGGIAFLAVAFMAIIGAILMTGVVRYLLKAIGYSKMYRKAGEAGWKAFIPVYNTYNNFKISWNGKLFFLYAALTVVSAILGVYTEGFLSLVGTAASLGVIYMIVKQNVNMAKLFGKGIGTGIALILFPGITSLILGLGKAEFTAIAE